MRDETLARELRGHYVEGLLLHPNRRYEPGRVCEREDCITVLSIYSPGPNCWVHSPLKFHLSRGERTDRRAPSAA